MTEREAADHLASVAKRMCRRTLATECLDPHDLHDLQMATMAYETVRMESYGLATKEAAWPEFVGRKS